MKPAWEEYADAEKHDRTYDGIPIPYEKIPYENKTVPKHIRDKCKRMEELCSKAYFLRVEVERWCEKNGIDTNSGEWRGTVVDECGGCDSILDANGIETLLNQ